MWRTFQIPVATITAATSRNATLVLTNGHEVHLDGIIIRVDGRTPAITGSPNGAVTGRIGDVVARTDHPAGGVVLYVKAVADNTNSDWINLSANVSTSAPSSTPAQIGQTHVNTSNGDYFVSVGTSASTDWRRMTPLTGTAAPSTTPARVGLFFVDTTNKKLYVSTGTSSSADWTILN